MSLTATRTAPEVLGFLHLVVCDGRHLNDFQHDPEAVAAELGATLTPEAVEEVRERPREELLSELYGHRFSPDSRHPHPYLVTNTPHADLGLTVLIGIAAGMVVTGVAAMVILSKDKNKKKRSAISIQDLSADASSKP